MSIVDDLVQNLVGRNAVELQGTLTIAFVDGGLKIQGTIVSMLLDQNTNKSILDVNIPVDANVVVGSIVIQLPSIP